MSEPAHKPLRILEIETFGRGGLTHYAYNLSLALAERAHEVTFVTGAAYELEGLSRLPANVSVVKAVGRASHKLGEASPALALSVLRKVEALYDSVAVARLARRIDPDVIHLHSTNPAALAFLRALEALGRPLVATAHVVTPHEPIPFQKVIYERIHGLGDLIVAHSEFDRKRLVLEFDVAPARVTVIPHGEYGFFDQGEEQIDRQAARESLGLGPKDQVALFFGYIREYKGLDVLLEAWPAISESRPAARLVIAGDPVRLSPERRGELERWATRVGALHRFGYIEFSEVGRYFAAADVLVMPYRHISQSGVLYLALALGVPVVATRVGALPEMLEDGNSALLVPPESPKELTQAVIRLLGDPALQEHLSRGGRRLAREHSWAAVAEQTERAFAQLVASHRASS